MPKDFSYEGIFEGAYKNVPMKDINKHDNTQKHVLLNNNLPMGVRHEYRLGDTYKIVPMWDIKEQPPGCSY